MTLKQRLISLIIVMLFSLTYTIDLYGQWYMTEIGALRNENGKLRAQVDSLSKKLAQMGDVDVLDYWSDLTGIEQENDFHELGGHRNIDTLTEEEDQLAAEIRMAAPFLIIPYKPIVGEYVDFYRIKKHRSMPAVIRRYEKYRPVFEKHFGPRNIPEEVMTLCIVESAVSPNALSSAGAYGMWQLMPETADRFGLQVNYFVDERTDVDKSTEAAAKYLAGAYKEFGSWPLAVLSYNCGPGNIRKAIIKAGGSSAFWDIYPYLPKETRGYLLSLIAVNHYIYIHSK